MDPNAPHPPPGPAARAGFVRAALLGVVALGGAVAVSLAQRDGGLTSLSDRAITGIGAVLLLVAGLLAARALGSAVQRATEPGSPAAARGLPLGKLVSIAGYLLVILWTLGAVGVPIQGLLLGGALTGVILGIAAQQTLGNVFAGIVLLVVRPLTIGQRAVLKSSLGEYDGMVTDMGMFYVSIQTQSGAVHLPNAVVLASAVGPGAKAPTAPS